MLQRSGGVFVTGRDGVDFEEQDMTHKRATALALALAWLMLAALAGCDAQPGTPEASDAGNSTSAAGEDRAASTAAELKPEPGYLVGQVFDTRGQPLPGATVLLSHGVAYARYLRGTTDADGRYRIQFDSGSWNPKAYLDKEYNGRRYNLELKPDSIDSVGMDGAVRNFRWVLQGPMPENDMFHYGATIEVRLEDGLWGDVDNIVLTMTPDGPLIDGSAGETLRIRRDDQYWSSSHLIQDVPIGRYQVTAMVEGEHGPRPLRLQDWLTEGEKTSSLQLDFRPRTPQGKTNYAHIALYEYE